MIDALVAGKLYGAPVERTSKAGRPFVTGKMRVATGNGESLFVGLVAFSDSAIAALLALADGDGCSVAGTLTASAFLHKDGMPRPALDMVVSHVLSAYSVGRKRKAMLPSDAVQTQEESPQAAADESAGAAQHEEFNDALPF